MPTYEYLCKSCNYNFDIKQKISDKELIQCPKCDDNTLIKQLSILGFGFSDGSSYKTGYQSITKYKPSIENDIKLI